MSNPWKLTNRQRTALALLAICGCRKVVCGCLGIGEAGLSHLVRRACDRMGALTDLQAVLMWDRWEREQIGRLVMPDLGVDERARVNAVLLRKLQRAVTWKKAA